MLTIRLFVRGLTRMAIRSLARKTATRAISQSALRGVTSRTVGKMVSRETDDLVSDMAGQLDVLEAFELAAEAPFMIQNAREAATAGGEAAWMAPYDLYNNGQKALVDQYCMPYTEEYWQSTDEPDPDVYLDGLYSMHEAIEQALSNTAEQSYEAGRQAGAMSLYKELSAYIAESLLNKGLDMASIKRAKNDWSEFGAEVMAERSRIQDMYDSGTLPGHIRARYQNGNLEWMVIKGPEFGGLGSRQLSWGQFFGNDQPFWFTEGRRLMMAHMQGHMTDAEYDFHRDSLYRSTYRNPWSTTSPAGYYRYTGPDWQIAN